MAARAQLGYIFQIHQTYMPVVDLAGVREVVMLTFDVSVIDVVLMLAVLVLLVLQMTNQPTKSVPKPRFSVTAKKSGEKPLRTAETQEVVEEARPQTDFQTSSPDCPQHLGYLKELPKDAPIPDECYRCLKMAECF